MISGLETPAPSSPHILRSDDGHCALWLGAIDDLWQLGKPRGHGGPWKGTEVMAGVTEVLCYGTAVMVEPLAG